MSQSNQEAVSVSPCLRGEASPEAPIVSVCAWCPEKVKAYVAARYPHARLSHDMCPACSEIQKLKLELRRAARQLAGAQDRVQTLEAATDALEAQLADALKLVEDAMQAVRSARQNAALQEIAAMQARAREQKLLQIAAVLARSTTLPDPATCEHLETVRGVCRLPLTEVLPDGSMKERPSRFEQHPDGRVECCTRCAALRPVGSKLWHKELASLYQAMSDE